MKYVWLYPVFLLTSWLNGFGQMKAPADWVNYEQVLGVRNDIRHYDYDVIVTRSSTSTNVLWPDDQPAYTLQVVNKTDAPIQASGRIELIRYGTRGRPNDVWLPEMVKFADAGAIPVKIDIAAHDTATLNITPRIPSVFGGYALIMDLGRYGRRLITSLVRTYAASPQRLQFPRQSLDDMGADFLQRVGVQAIRMGVDYTPTTAPDYRAKMEALGHKLKEYKEKNITVLLMFGAGTAAMPLGMSRPFLDSANVMRKTKQDYAWLPSSDGDFKAFVNTLCVRYGWPQGPVTAVSLWNEPWEGMSISGWQADIIRYREIYSAMAAAVLDARKQGAEVLVGGGDSNSNAWDKLFADGKMTFLPIFDFCSIHYQGMESPALYPEWVNRQSPNGRVKIWDTESWVGNTDDRIGLVVATNRSAGYDRSMGIYAGYMSTKSKGCVPDAWSATAAVGAVQHLVGERDFKALLFTNGLPWVMLFDGYKNDPDDGTAVICGDIGDAFGAEHVLFRGVRKMAGGSLTLRYDSRFRLYDFYGNPISPIGGKLTVPLDYRGYYLRTDGSKGSFAILITAIRTAYIKGYDPVEIIAKDIIGRIGQKSMLELQITNVLNRSVEGKLQVFITGLNILAPSTIKLAPNETVTIPVQVTGGVPAPDNTYPLSVHFDAGVDGVAVHDEDMHVNLISSLSISVDGRLDDWPQALPQTVRNTGTGNVTLTEAAWYPFKNFDTHAGGYANGYFAYDSSYFYFAAKVADSTPHAGTYRFEQRSDDEFFYPDTAYVMDMQGTLVVKEGATDTLHYWESGDNTNSFGLDLQLPVGRLTRVAFYLPNIKVYGVMMEVVDVASGKQLLQRKVDNLWKGAYEVFDLSGKVRVIFHSYGWWYTPKLAGIFFDDPAATGGTLSASAAISSGAAFIKEDLDTKGSWKGVYGGQGYHCIGGQSHLPRGVVIQIVNKEIKTSLIWPAGIRHFTYRKNPVTPDNSGLGYMYDNVLLAFNVLPEGEDGLLSHPPGTMPRYTGYKCTDYEYALNQVAPQYGGGTEIWRLLAPGLNRKHFFPRQPRSEGEGPVRDGKLVIRREGSTLITECAIPWSELPDVHKAMLEGRRVKLSFRVNDNGAPGSCMELAKERSVSKLNARAFHPDWKAHWANEVEFAFETGASGRQVPLDPGRHNSLDLIGDGHTINTVAIQHQIDSCSRIGGGLVHIPAGRFLTGTLYLRSNVDLHLDEGAVLLGSTLLQDYPVISATNGKRSLIFAGDAENISITGKGVIDGQGGDSLFQRGDNGSDRPYIVFFSGCRKVKVQDITLRNAPFWVQYYSGCDGLVICGITVYSHCNWNNDGIDIDSRNVTVEDCTIDTDDDALCFKSESALPCEHIRVNNCRLASNCNAIKMGTASQTGFRYISVKNCMIKAAAEDNRRHWQRMLQHITAARTVLSGIALESVDGGEMDSITISGIRMTDVQTPVFIRLGDRQRSHYRSGSPVSSIRNLFIDDVIARSQSLIPCVISGIPGHLVENVVLSNIRVIGPGGGTAEQAVGVVPEKEGAYPENRMFGYALPASCLYARHVKGLSLSHLQFSLLQRDLRPAFVLTDSKGVRVRDTVIFLQNTGVSRQTGSGKIVIDSAKFAKGDELIWKEPAFNDKAWNSIRTDTPWEQQGYKGYDGYGWYRIHFVLPSSLIAESRLKDSLRINLSRIDDADEIYLNGLRIGKNGAFPGDSTGFITKYYATREYHLSVKDKLLRWDGDNVIAIRVYDGGGNGGMMGPMPFINMVDLIDGVDITLHTQFDNTCKVEFVNHSAMPVEGIISMRVADIATGREVESFNKAVVLPPFGQKDTILRATVDRQCGIVVIFTEEHTGKAQMRSMVSSFILTPPAPSTPRINGARVFGVRPHSPFLFKIPATGERPLRYGVKNLPAGLTVDEQTGIITGSLATEGNYHMQLVAGNAKGRAERGFTIKVGSLLALTPPMGWNSWNCWGLSVSDEKVRSSAQALIDKGLADHGWNYINIDDAWQGVKRAADGNITTNERFPDMKGLGDWLHGRGLKFGVYSSPGPQTCGRYMGSYGHEVQDAATYAGWGVDYLKYDWCSYGKLIGKDTALSTFVKPYQVMDQALRSQSRDILYSLCQYGMKDVWKWGKEVDGNCWRTTGDITDSWESVKATGFSQAGLYSYAGPGHWNDPDMLVVGQLGWGDPHPTRLTADEQYAHISLWCLQSAPLLIGGDISKMDDFTLSLLSNDEVIALDQDGLGLQAQRVVGNDTCQVWVKELEDGCKAVGIFNMSDTERTISLRWADLPVAMAVRSDQRVRDLWRQKDLGVFGEQFQTRIAAHGVRLIKISPLHNTMVPVVQNRDGVYDWQVRHAEIIALNQKEPPVNVIMGNSIVNYWGGRPKAPISNGGDSWDKWLEPLGVRNMGLGWDKIENVLWRVLHGELDGFEARHVVLMIGTNNLGSNTDDEIVGGLRLLVEAVRQRQPRTGIILSGLLPRRNLEARIEALNREIEKLAGEVHIAYMDPGELLLQGADSKTKNAGSGASGGKIDESFFGDGLHPNAEGYRRIAPVIAGYCK